MNLVSMTTLTGLTWIIDSQTLGDVFWSSAKKLFSDPYTEKVVFDGKHIADYLLNKHGYELRGRVCLLYSALFLQALLYCLLVEWDYCNHVCRSVRSGGTGGAGERPYAKQEPPSEDKNRTRE